jgi:hypothetical protein
MEWRILSVQVSALGQFYIIAHNKMHYLNVYRIILVVDPRYKLTWFKQVGWRKEWIEAAKKSVTEVWNVRYKSSNCKQATPSIEGSASGSDTKKNAFHCILASQMKGADKPSRDREDELKCYLMEPVVSADKIDMEKTGVNGVLGWWKVRKADNNFQAALPADTNPLNYAFLNNRFTKIDFHIYPAWLEIFLPFLELGSLLRGCFLLEQS